MSENLRKRDAVEITTSRCVSVELKYALNVVKKVIKVSVKSKLKMKS